MVLQGKKILIVGFGKSGQAALHYCLSQGARCAVTDVRGKEAFSNPLSVFSRYPVDWFFGAHDEAVFLSADMIVVSPGVPWNLEPLKAARQKKIPVISEIELAFLNQEPFDSAQGRPRTKNQELKIIAVTGTNGKTTTVSLIHHLLTTAGKKSLLAGNVGRPLLACLDEAQDSEFLVLEVSSYQLEVTPSLKPDVAVWLNITEDHLDWHESFEAYVLAKTKLIKQTAPKGLVVYNGEDSIVTASTEQIPSPRWMFSTKRVLKIGGWVEEGGLCIKTEVAKPTLRFELAKVSLKGIHNWENMLAALLAISGDVPLQGNAPILQKGLETFVPLPHRMQVVRRLGGVTYINDSKGTNVGASLKALASLNSPILWIAGGRDKGGSYEFLREWVKKKSEKRFCWVRQKKKWPMPCKDVGRS